MLLRLLFGQFGLDLSGQGLVFAPRTVLVSVAVGVVVTVVAAALPARRTARIAPVQALRDDVALPESSIRRRLLVGALLAVFGFVSMAFGLFLDVPEPLTFVGVGALGMLLGVASASVVIGRPVLHAAHAIYARFFGPVGNLAGQNALRNPRRTTATASALMIGLAAGRHLPHRGRLVQGAGRQVHRRGVRRRLRGVERVRRRVQRRASRTRWRPSTGSTACCGSGSRSWRWTATTSSSAAVDPAAVGPLELSVVDGSGTLGDREVLVQESYADEHGVAIGDTLDIQVPAGRQDWTVTGVFEDNPVVFAGLVTTIATFEAAGFEPADNALIVFADDGPAADGLAGPARRHRRRAADRHRQGPGGVRRRSSASRSTSSCSSSSRCWRWRWSSPCSAS